MIIYIHFIGMAANIQIANPFQNFCIHFELNWGKQDTECDNEESGFFILPVATL